MKTNQYCFVTQIKLQLKNSLEHEPQTG